MAGPPAASLRTFDTLAPPLAAILASFIAPCRRRRRRVCPRRRRDPSRRRRRHRRRRRPRRRRLRAHAAAAAAVLVIPFLLCAAFLVRGVAARLRVLAVRVHRRLQDRRLHIHGGGVRLPRHLNRPRHFLGGVASCHDVRHEPRHPAVELVNLCLRRLVLSMPLRRQRLSSLSPCRAVLGRGAELGQSPLCLLRTPRQVMLRRLRLVLRRPRVGCHLVQLVARAAQLSRHPRRLDPLLLCLGLHVSHLVGHFLHLLFEPGISAPTVSHLHLMNRPRVHGLQRPRPNDRDRLVHQHDGVPRRRHHSTVVQPATHLEGRRHVAREQHAPRVVIPPHAVRLRDRNGAQLLAQQPERRS